MAYQPVDEDNGPAAGRHFGVRIAPFVRCDVLAVRGVRMRNTSLVAVVTVVQDDVTGEWLAGYAYAARDEMSRELEDEDDG
jgi:hypothetical protein